MSVDSRTAAPAPARDDTPHAPDAAPGVVMSHKQILLVIYGLMAGMFLSSLNQTVVGTSMRTIADDLDGLSLQAWVTTAFLIVSTIATPIYGKLSDIFGRRPLFIIAISIFLVGSVASGFAASMVQLAGFRALQGLGAGGLMALPLAIMGDMLAPRQRAKYQGYFLAVFGVSSLLGPLIGGLFAGADEILGITGWRWVFLINLPIGAIALAMVLRFLHLPRHGARRDVRIDWWGAATVIIAVTPLLLVAEQGRDWGWASPISLACYVVGALGLIAFVLVERGMGDDALIPLKLFRSSTFSMATVLGVLVGFGMFGALSTIPLYLQLVNGSSPTESGFQLLPMILGLMISSIASGQIIARTGRYRIFPTIGTAFLAGGFLLFCFLRADSSIWFLMTGMLLVGLGLGQLMQTLTIASQNAVGPRDMGVATSSATFFRQIGGTLGVAVLFSVLFTRIPDTLAERFADSSLIRPLRAAIADPTVLADPDNRPILELLQSAQSGGGDIGSSLDGDTAFLNAADPRLAAPFLNGFSDATVSVFQVSLVVVLIAFVLSFFLKATPLREKSALQESADADAALLAQQAGVDVGAPLQPATSTDDVDAAPAKGRSGPSSAHSVDAEEDAPAR